MEKKKKPKKYISRLLLWERSKNSKWDSTSLTLRFSSFKLYLRPQQTHHNLNSHPLNPFIDIAQSSRILVQKFTDLLSGNTIFFPCFLDLHFDFLSIASQFLPLFASTKINSLSYFDTHSMACPFGYMSVPGNGPLETLSSPYLEEFESYIEIFCDVCSSSWLVKAKGPANSTKKKVNTEMRKNRRKTLQGNTTPKRFSNAIKTSMRKKPSSCLCKSFTISIPGQVKIGI